MSNGGPYEEPSAQDEAKMIAVLRVEQRVGSTGRDGGTRTREREQERGRQRVGAGATGASTRMSWPQAQKSPRSRNKGGG